MWTRKMLKENAWNSLKGYYWTAFGVCWLAGILGGSSSGGSSSGGSLSSSTTEDLEALFESESAGEIIAFVIGILVAAVFISIFALAVGFALYAFLGGPVEAGKCKFFLKAREGDAAFGHMFDNFGSGKYMATVKTMFFRYLYTYLWSLLFVIPGIVKSYEYYLIPYLVAENPNISKERAFEISRRTMDGEKWDAFILNLSFIGWEILGLMACCIGIMFVQPYEEATRAEFYACMRAKAIARGITSEEELTGMPALNMNYDQNNGF